jgi:hypothetical protein
LIALFVVTFAAVAQIATNLVLWKGQRRIEMAINMTAQELLDKVDAATTAASKRVADLIASIKGGGAKLSDAQQAEADAITAHLDALGADSSNPVPAPAPPATPSTPSTPATPTP